jgi:hypothetical protein
MKINILTLRIRSLGSEIPWWMVIDAGFFTFVLMIIPIEEVIIPGVTIVDVKFIALSVWLLVRVKDLVHGFSRRHHPAWTLLVTVGAIAATVLLVTLMQHSVDPCFKLVQIHQRHYVEDFWKLRQTVIVGCMRLVDAADYSTAQLCKVLGLVALIVGHWALRTNSRS